MVRNLNRTVEVIIMGKNQTSAFAIVRVEGSLFSDEMVPVGNRITVKRILWNLDVAEKEVRRLNELNGDKGCVYFWQATRVDVVGPEEGS